MTTTHVELATDPAEHTAVFVRAYNSGDIDAVRLLFEPDAVLVAEPGESVTGEDIFSLTKEFLDGGQPMSATTRHVYTAGDIALLIVDWSVDGATGTSTDVIRRGPDGRWRYLIDNPAGTSPAH